MEIILFQIFSNLSYTQNLKKSKYFKNSSLFLCTYISKQSMLYQHQITFSLFFRFLPIFHILGLRTSILYKEIWEVSSNPETDPPNRIKTYFEHFSTEKNCDQKLFLIIFKKNHIIQNLFLNIFFNYYCVLEVTRYTKNNIWTNCDYICNIGS